MERVWVGSIDPAALGRVDGLDGRWRRFVNNIPSDGGLVFGMGELAPGERAGPHEHPEPELFFVLEGTADISWVDASDATVHYRRLEPGMAFYKPGGVRHEMFNSGVSAFRGVFAKVSLK